MVKEIEVKTKRYKCENCGATYNSCGHFSICKLCGKEVCDKCSEKVPLYYTTRGIWQGDFYVHKTCKRHHETWKDVYIKAINYLQNEFYNQIEELNKEYLLENDEYMRKWQKSLEQRKEE